VSFDSGVLIALERGETRAWAWMKRATERREPPLVSVVAVAECWRDHRGQRNLARALQACDVRDVDLDQAKAAGRALGDVAGSGTSDALIAALAARTGAVLVTADIDDMRQLADGHFRALRLASL